MFVLTVASAQPRIGGRTLTCLPLVAFAGNELFAGLYSDYWGRDSAIFRSMGKLGHIRTEHDDERLLKGRSEETMENESTVHD